MSSDINDWWRDCSNYIHYLEEDSLGPNILAVEPSDSLDSRYRYLSNERSTISNRLLNLRCFHIDHNSINFYEYEELAIRMKGELKSIEKEMFDLLKRLYPPKH